MINQKIIFQPESSLTTTLRSLVRLLDLFEGLITGGRVYYVFQGRLKWISCKYLVIYVKTLKTVILIMITKLQYIMQIRRDWVNLTVCKGNCVLSLLHVFTYIFRNYTMNWEMPTCLCLRWHSVYPLVHCFCTSPSLVLTKGQRQRKDNILPLCAHFKPPFMSHVQHNSFL